MSGWTHYYPPWYPIQTPPHNPWFTEDQNRKQTMYRDWVDTLEPGELKELIAEYHQTQRISSSGQAPTVQMREAAHRQCETDS